MWEDYHEASAGYRKLQKYIIEKPDVEKGNGGQPDNQGKPEENLPEIDFCLYGKEESIFLCRPLSIFPHVSYYINA